MTIGQYQHTNRPIPIIGASLVSGAVDEYCKVLVDPDGVWS